MSYSQEQVTLYSYLITFKRCYRLIELSTPTAWLNRIIAAISMINNIYTEYKIHFFALSLLICISRHFQLTVKIVTWKLNIKKYSTNLLNVKDSFQKNPTTSALNKFTYCKWGASFYSIQSRHKRSGSNYGDLSQIPNT